MNTYLQSVLANIAGQFVQLVMIPFVLAYCLQWIGSRIRLIGVGLAGRAYWYFVAPGVACHETGHAAGCILTGTKVSKFVPFYPKDGVLGYVQHKARTGLFGGFANLLICTGPIWFGSLMIILLSHLFNDSVGVIRYGDYFSNNAVPSVLNYVIALFCASLGLLFGIFSGDVLSWQFLLWFYLSFCIASEIGMSGVDIAHMRGGLGWVAGFFVALNAVLPVGRLVSMGIFVAMPYLFKVHVLMLTALMVNLMFLSLLRLYKKLKK